MSDKKVTSIDYRPKQPLEWHASLPVCLTLKGCQEHLAVLGRDDLQEMCRKLNCSINELTERLHSLAKASQSRKKRK